MHLEQIFGSFSSSRKSIGIMVWGVHCLNSRLVASSLIFNRFTLAVTALVYCSYKMVCTSGCVQLTHLKQTFVSSTSPRKFIGSMLGGIHHSNSRPAASPLIFNRFTIATIGLVYWRSKKVCSSGCVRQTNLKQIFGSFSLSRKRIGTVLRGIHRSNSRPPALPFIDLL